MFQSKEDNNKPKLKITFQADELLAGIDIYDKGGFVGLCKKKLDVIAKMFDSNLVLERSNVLIENTEEVPRDVVCIEDRVLYFTTSAGVYRADPENGYLAQLLNQNEHFCGLDYAGYRLFMVLQDNTICMYDVLFDSIHEFFKGDNRLADVTAYVFRSKLIIFALETDGKIRAMFYTMSECKSVILQPRRGQEILCMKNPMGITVQRNCNKESLVLLVCDTHKNRIIEIHVDCNLLIKHTEEFYDCSFAINWVSESFLPVSISASGHEVFFSASHEGIVKTSTVFKL